VRRLVVAVRATTNRPAIALIANFSAPALWGLDKDKWEILTDVLLPGSSPKHTHYLCHIRDIDIFNSKIMPISERRVASFAYNGHAVRILGRFKHDPQLG